ncbi:MAG TPA: hypothetical protein VNZ26_15660, partial [Vicinamibacterales bacterium]|nr:hypothetical protein [Vicinamibacterales bacterium]
MYLLADFTPQCVGCAFAEFDRATRRAAEMLALEHVMTVPDENPVVASEDADSNGANRRAHAAILYCWFESR